MVAPRLHDRDALVPDICARLREGEPLAVICRDLDIPRRTVNQWRQDDEEIAAQFDEARDEGYDTIAASCMRISDQLKEDPASRRVRIETRLKLLAKWDPRRYGDKMQQEITGKDGAPLAISVVERRIVKPAPP